MKKPHELHNIILEIVALNAVALGLVIGTANAFAADDNGESWKAPLAVEFSKLDTSGNGLLLPNEAQKGHAFNRKSFAQADVDHDGTIDQDEYIHFKTGQWPKDYQTVKNNAAPSVSSPSQETTNNSAAPNNADPEKMMEEHPTGAGIPDNKLKMDNDLKSSDPSQPLDAPDSNAIPSDNGPEQLNHEQNQPVPESSNRGSLDDLMAPTVAELDQYTHQVKFQTSDSITRDTAGKAIDDNVINTKAIATLLDTDELEGIEISVETHQGEVMLDGFVNSEKDKMKTEYIVSMIDGVKSVRNYLKIRS